MRRRRRDLRAASIPDVRHGAAGRGLRFRRPGGGKIYGYTHLASLSARSVQRTQPPCPPTKPRPSEKLAPNPPHGPFDAANTSQAGRYGDCFATPGPADPTLHCAATKGGTWLGWLWYKFVDQPALQRLSLSDEERAFMQSRVETLHSILNADAPKSDWIKPVSHPVRREARTRTCAHAHMREHAPTDSRGHTPCTTRRAARRATALRA